MADRKKVISDLSTALVQIHGCGRYTPEDVDELETAAWGALKLLEEQKAEGYWMQFDLREHATISAKCSCCGWEAHYYEDDVAGMPYCPNCGAKMKAVKLNE